jgi:hypothetical protein
MDIAENRSVATLETLTPARVLTRSSFQTRLLIRMPAPAPWIEALTNEVASTISGVDLLAPLGCHTSRDGAIWEITLFVAATEIVGGVADGSLTYSRFVVDIPLLLQVFSHVISLGWYAGADRDVEQLGSHLSLEGYYGENHIWLRIPDRPPSVFGPGRVVRVHDQTVEELW